MYSHSASLQFLHIKPEGVGVGAAAAAAATPKNCRTLFMRKEVTKSTRADLLKCKATSPPVLSYNVINFLDDLNIQPVIEKQSRVFPRKETQFDPALLTEAYESCRQICQHSTTYYLGSLLLTDERKRAVWAIYAWGQRIDELVDGANANLVSSSVLDSWEERLEDIFNGCPHDITDTALADTVQRFPLDIKPFKDLIQGMRMDTRKSRYQNFGELELYCYYVTGTCCLMTIPIVGISTESVSSTRSIYQAALSLGIGHQLTNILRDVEEDASRGRVYLPQDELKDFGLTDEDIFSRNVTKEWREFTKQQIARARYYYDQGEHIVSQLNRASRWPVLASSMLYRKILDKIEENDYDNLTKRAKVGCIEKLLTLPLAYAKAMGCSDTKSLPH